MKRPGIFLWIILFSASGCTLPIMQCFLSFKDYRKTFSYSFSKEELKDRLVEAYTYDEGLFIQNLGKTLIENEAVNEDDRLNQNIWIHKSNWDNFKTGIRNNTPDTVDLIIGKHWSRKKIQMLIILQGNSSSSTLTVHGFTYQQPKVCRKENEYYVVKLSDKIEKKFIRKLTHD